MAALICIKRVRGTFCQLVNIANRFLRIFSNIEASIRFIFPGGAGYPYLPTRLSASAMFLSHNLDSFETLMRKRIFKFSQRVINSKNAIINMLSNNYIVLVVPCGNNGTHDYILVVCLVYDKGGWMGGSRIRYSIKNVVLIRDSISEISP